MCAVHVYLSSFFDSRFGRRTGIARVEHRIARELVSQGGSAITYSFARRCFVTLDFQQDVEAVAQTQDLSPDDFTTSEPHPSQDWLHRAANALSNAAVAIGGPIGINAFAWVSDALSDETRIKYAERLDLFTNPRAAIRYQRARRRGLRGMLAAVRPRAATQFNTGDVILVPGIVWHHAPLAELDRLKRQCGIRIAAYVHDLIPIRHPEYHTDDLGVVRFRRFMDEMVRNCDVACANSDFVAVDLAKYASESGRTKLPITKVPLCAELQARTPQRCTPRLQALGLTPDHFVLYVSTLNVRKNHAGMYALWRRLMRAMPNDQLPPLVFAGQRGWGTDDVLRLMSRDNAAWGRTVVFVEAPTDSELSYLYANCSFTVFPSDYEGWGLGVTESLEFGKPCIAADNSALREAGQGLAIHIDTIDGLTWLQMLQKMIEDREYRESVKARIRRDYKPRTWAEVGVDVRKAITLPSAKFLTAPNTLNPNASSWLSPDRDRAQ